METTFISRGISTVYELRTGDDMSHATRTAFETANPPRNQVDHRDISIFRTMSHCGES
jgi:hypothetical protein